MANASGEIVAGCRKTQRPERSAGCAPPMTATATVMTDLRRMLLPKERKTAKDKTAGQFLFVNSASSAGFRAIAGMTRIGILLSIARAYGPGSFGQLSLAMSLVEILRTFS